MARVDSPAGAGETRGRGRIDGSTGSAEAVGLGSLQEEEPLRRGKVWPATSRELTTRKTDAHREVSSGEHFVRPATRSTTTTSTDAVFFHELRKILRTAPPPARCLLVKPTRARGRKFVFSSSAAIRPTTQLARCARRALVHELPSVCANVGDRDQRCSRDLVSPASANDANARPGLTPNPPTRRVRELALPAQP